MEQWLEVSIKVKHEAEEVTAEILREAGARNEVVIEDPVLYETVRKSLPFELCDPLPEETDLSVVTVTAYYPEDEELQKRLQRIEAELTAVEKRIGRFRIGPTLFRKVSETDWSDEWKQYFHVTRVGKHIVVKPSWESYEPEAEDIGWNWIPVWLSVRARTRRRFLYWKPWKKWFIPTPRCLTWERAAAFWP